jgi:FlaG/FlaF family flagellin (archaellin)
MHFKTLIAVALASVSLGLVGVAEAAVSTTKLTISNEDEVFTGSLSSGKAACESDRKVTLSKVTLQKGKVKTATKVGSDVSNDDGDWTVKSGKTGKFRATVKATSKCGAATSKIITVVEE